MTPNQPVSSGGAESIQQEALGILNEQIERLDALNEACVEPRCSGCHNRMRRAHALAVVRSVISTLLAQLTERTRERDELYRAISDGDHDHQSYVSLAKAHRQDSETMDAAEEQDHTRVDGSL